MSIVHADSFDIYGTSASYLTDGVYASTSNAVPVADPDGASTQKVLRFNSNLDSELRYSLATADNKVGVANRVWMSYLPVNDASRPDVISWRDASNREVAKFRIDTTGRISFYACTTTDVYGEVSLIATTTNPVVTAEGWWHIESCLDSSANTFELRVEGIVRLDLDSGDFTLNVGVGDTYQVSLEGHDSNDGGPAMYIKDLVIWDGNGSVNNDFLGSVSVVNLVPTGDDSVGWSLSTGSTAYTILDNDPPNDSQYIYADDSPPSSTVVSMADLSSDVSSVKAIVTYVRATKSDGGDGTLQVNVKATGGGVDNGADRPITTAFLWWRDVSELDPDTASPWARTAVNASELEIDRTS